MRRRKCSRLMPQPHALAVGNSRTIGGRCHLAGSHRSRQLGALSKTKSAPGLAHMCRPSTITRPDRIMRRQPGADRAMTPAPVMLIEFIARSRCRLRRRACQGRMFANLLRKLLESTPESGVRRRAPWDAAPRRVGADLLRSSVNVRGPAHLEAPRAPRPTPCPA